MPTDHPPTIQEGPLWKEWPETWDSWPVYFLGEAAHHWRNGREAGAWLSGIVNGIPEKCARVEVEEAWIAGAVLAMIEGGLNIGPYSTGQGSSTFAVHVAFLSWGPERVADATYSPPGLVATLEVR